MVKNLRDQGESQFSFKRTTVMKKAGIDLVSNNMLTNYTFEDNMAMNGSKPWWAGHEKDPRFLQMLLEATTVEGDLVIDCSASTG
jgi:hypothetical protein